MLNINYMEGILNAVTIHTSGPVGKKGSVSLYQVTSGLGRPLAGHDNRSSFPSISLFKKSLLNGSESSFHSGSNGKGQDEDVNKLFLENY